jgi:hypothetical protein
VLVCAICDFVPIAAAREKTISGRVDSASETGSLETSDPGPYEK